MTITEELFCKPPAMGVAGMSLAAAVHDYLKPIPRIITELFPNCRFVSISLARQFWSKKWIRLILPQKQKRFVSPVWIIVRVCADKARMFSMSI